MAITNSDYANFFPIQRKTPLPGGYMGKILRVDLSTGKFIDLNLPEEPLLRKYWGGQLFAEYVLLKELPLDIDPYDSRNVIVGMTGPVTGTGFTPGGTKTCFVYLSPATRYTLGRAATSGYFGSSLKSAGYDGMIMPDHVPRIDGDTNGAQAFAYAFGYVQALIQLVNSEA